MFEELISQLDSLGVSYTEDYDMGTLTIDVASIDKSLLIEVISALNSGGYEFSIDESSITVQGAIEEEVIVEDEDAMLDETFATM